MTSGQNTASPAVDAEFVAALLHKFSQPLTALRGSLELALEFSTTPEEYRQGIQEAMEQADRLVRLKKVLMELSRPQDFTAGAQRAEVSSLLETALEEALPVAERLGVRMETSYPAPLYTVVSVPRVTQALALLLNTFLEYSSGSTVVISCVQSDGQALTTFSNGHGAIPESELPRLFEAFTPSRSRSHDEDSGLWLALARKIVEATGGTVHAENTAPDGFRFLIRLPLTTDASRASAA